MLEPITSPSGSKPASLTSRNSLIERSLVKNFFWRISTSRSRAWIGRSAAGATSGATQSSSGSSLTATLLRRLFFGLLRELRDLVRLLLFLDDIAALFAAERHHRHDQRRHRRRRRLLKPRDAADAGREPADVDIHVVQRAAFPAARDLLDVELDVGADDKLGAERVRLRGEPLLHDAARFVDRLASAVDLAGRVAGLHHVPHVVAAEVEQEAARLEAIARQRPQVLTREIREDRPARRVRDPRRAHRGAHDGELDDLATIVAAL